MIGTMASWIVYKLFRISLMIIQVRLRSQVNGPIEYLNFMSMFIGEHKSRYAYKNHQRYIVVYTKAVYSVLRPQKCILMYGVPQCSSIYQDHDLPPFIFKKKCNWAFCFYYRHIIIYPINLFALPKGKLGISNWPFFASSFQSFCEEDFCLQWWSIVLLMIKNVYNLHMCLYYHNII